MNGYVYQVKGSEDGTLGIYGSKKRAIARAKEYVQVAYPGEEIQVEHNGKWFVEVHSGEHSVVAEIEKFPVE